MTKEQNIRAILECNFSGYKDEIIDSATKRILDTIDAERQRYGSGIINQIRWERDTAIAQLAEIGKGLGERMDDFVKVVRCKDCTNFTRGKDEWGNCFENPMKMWRETDFCSWAERRDDGTE